MWPIGMTVQRNMYHPAFIGESNCYWKIFGGNYGRYWPGNTSVLPYK